MYRSNAKKSGFSLVELVVVIVIIGILAAVAIPRLSRGSAGASDAALSADLTLIRNAINMYAAEHNNKFPDGTAAQVADKLTKYSSATGATQATRDATYKFGPYLVAIPPCPVGENAGDSDVLISTDSPPTVVTGGGEGWVYNVSTGEFVANTTTTDQTGTAYNTY